MSPADQHPLEMLVLNSLFDAGGTMTVAELRAATSADGRALRKAIDAQRAIGNLRQAGAREPVTLTASARAAIAAGRANKPMMLVTFPARRVGKKAAEQLLRSMAEFASQPSRIEVRP